MLVNFALVPATAEASGRALPHGALAVGLRETVADASLLFLIGGLVMLGFILVVVVVQSLLPDRAGLMRSTARAIRPLKGAGMPATAFAAEGADRGLKLTPPRVDAALDKAVQESLGEPRLLRALEHFSRVRLYGCRECQAFASGEATASPGVSGGCDGHRARIEAHFRSVYTNAASVREAACRRRGDPHCEFEVRH